MNKYSQIFLFLLLASCSSSPFLKKDIRQDTQENNIPPPGAGARRHYSEPYNTGKTLYERQSYQLRSGFGFENDIERNKTFLHKNYRQK